MKPKSLSISTFRRHAHELLDDLPAEGVVITKPAAQWRASHRSRVRQSITAGSLALLRTS